MNSNDRYQEKNPSISGELEAHGDRLRSEINALHHELRRVRDGLERVGGVSPELEQRAKRLSKNIELCEKDLKQNQRLQARDYDED